MRRCICLLVAWGAALITICAVFSRPLLEAWSFCLLVLGAALSPVLYEMQDFALDRSNPLVKRGIELHQAAQELVKQRGGPWDVDPIVSVYFPAGSSFQDAVVILRAAHASIEGPKLFVGTRPDGKTTEWFGVRAIIFFGGIAGGPQVDLMIESDRQHPTTIEHAAGFTMDVDL